MDWLWDFGIYWGLQFIPEKKLLSFNDVRCYRDAKPAKLSDKSLRKETKIKAGEV